MAAVAAVVLWAWLDKESFGSVSSQSRCVLSNFGWLFVVAADVLLCLVLAFSRFGRIRRGSHDLRPEFGNLAWIAMLFSAGTGIGVMFYGVGEPLTHLLPGTAPASGVRPESAAAAATALEHSSFHWTLTPWAICGIAGLALACAGSRKGRGNRLSAAFVSLIGTERAEARPGKATDLLAVSPPSSAPPPALARSHFRARKGSTSRRASRPHGPPNS